MHARPRSPFSLVVPEGVEDSELSFVVPPASAQRAPTPPLPLGLKRPVTPPTLPADGHASAPASGRRTPDPTTPRGGSAADAAASKLVRSACLRLPSTTPRTILFWLACAVLSLCAGFALPLLMRGGAGARGPPVQPAPAPFWHLHPLADVELPQLSESLASQFSVRQQSSPQKSVIVAFTDWGASD